MRKKACYFWLSPANDAMGYNNDKDYECLSVNVDIDECVVTNMDLISAAYVNFIMEKDNKAMYEYRKLVAAYDETAVKYLDYGIGLFRTPEVIIQGNIDPQNIEVVQASDIDNQYTSNRDLYNANIGSIYDQLTAMEKVAIHDDSTGLLSTYKQKDKEEYYTIEESFYYGK